MASAPTETGTRALLDRLREITELLESIAADRNVLAGIPDQERARLLRAVELVNKADEALHETGIRTLRRKPVFTTPNVFPPEGFAPVDIHGDGAESGSYGRESVRETTEPQHCYVCKQKYTVIHHFYDQLCPD